MQEYVYTEIHWNSPIATTDFALKVWYRVSAHSVFNGANDKEGNNEEIKNEALRLLTVMICNDSNELDGTVIRQHYLVAVTITSVPRRDWLISWLSQPIKTAAE